MSPTRVEAFECPVCSELVDVDEQTTHLNDCLDFIEAWKCDECDAVYEEKSEANECCPG